MLIDHYYSNHYHCSSSGWNIYCDYRCSLISSALFGILSLDWLCHWNYLHHSYL